MRNFGRDEPELDAEDYGRDSRPVIGACCICGRDIYGENVSYYGDDAYDVGGELFHDGDCAREWLEQFKV